MVVSSVSRQILWVRVPAVIALLIAWRILRTTFATGSRRRVVEWTMASVFCTFAGAWMVTTRPEPLVASLSVVTLLAARRYIERRDVGWLALGGAMAAVAVSLHPSGSVTAAPLLVLAPVLVRDLRKRTVDWSRVAAAIGAAAAILLLLVFADSDVASWSANSEVFASAGQHQAGWRDELARYTTLFEPPYDTVLRRMSVLVAALTVVLVLAGTSRKRAAGDLVTSWSLAAAFVLLAVTPSKWPWHFGSLGALAVAALAVEVRHLLDDPAEESVLRRALCVVGAIGVSTVAWRALDLWEQFALIDVDAELWTTIARWLSNPLVWIVLGGMLLLLVTRRMGRARARVVLASAAPLVVVAPAVILTAAHFSIDGFGADDWSVAKQNAHFLLGHDYCGLGSVVTIADPASAAPAPPGDAPAATTDGLPPDILGLANLDPATPGAYPGGRAPTWPGTPSGTWVTGDADVGWFASPWVEIPAGARSLYLGVAGSVRRNGNRLLVQTAEPSASGWEIGEAVDLDVTHSSEDWSLVTIGREDRTSPVNVRVVVVDVTAGLQGWVAVTDILTSPAAVLETLYRDADLTVLLTPYYRLFYPCIDEPPLAHGVAVVPDLSLGDVPLVPESAPGLVDDPLGEVELRGVVGDEAPLEVVRVLPGPPWVEVPWELAP
jgi:hypothetical protein